jgi:3D (Asp-Asp-Asp) domain-containing protein
VTAGALTPRRLTGLVAGPTPPRRRRPLWPWLLAGPLVAVLGLVVLTMLLIAGATSDCGSHTDAPGALGGVDGTGLTPAEIRTVRTGSPFAGTTITPGRYVTTSYGPPWGGIQGAGLSTSGGLRIDGGSPRWYMLAVDPRLISHGTLVYLWPNPFRWTGPFLVADTGGAIHGRRIDVYDWRGRTSQTAWGRRTVTVSPQPVHHAASAVAALAPVADCQAGVSADGSGRVLGLPGPLGQVTVAPLADAPGHPLRPALSHFIRRVAGIAGRPLVLTTGTNHTELTVSGNVSDHVLGLAGDFGSVANRFPIGGGFGTTLAAAALRAAGIPADEALRVAVAGGGHNVCHAGWRVQVIWRTGGHYDHVHIGLRHGCDFTGVQTFQL